MLNYIWAFMICVSVVYAAFTGNIGAVSEAVIDSSSQAVNLAISMLGVVALWCGVMEIAEKSGVVKLLEKILSPIINWLFPRLKGEECKKAKEYITLNFIMNMLGTGWSATGPGLLAMKELKEIDCFEKRKALGNISYDRMQDSIASDEMCIFLTLNISSLQLIPVNIIAYRNAYGAVAPAEIVLPALLATMVSTVVAVVVCKMFCLWK